MATARVVSVNVGMPRDVPWRGRLVHTGIWKSPVAGRCRVGRLNLVGDGQGDLAGHGGEHRAVFVYQLDSYRHWQERLGRSDLTHGQFGENLTVEGLPDDQVCIGDRYQIGSARFEVTQPRVTCYRVGMRLDEPRMPALLTSSGRPGFYLRVVQEGEVGAGDPILKLAEDTERMTVAEVNALLYSSSHPADQLERALRLRALPAGWRASFEALLSSQRSPGGARGNAGLSPAAAANPAAPGFRPLRVAERVQDLPDVVSLSLEATDGRPLAVPQPGQFVVVRLPAGPGGAQLYRSYSLSGAPSPARYRISVKIEPGGVAGAWLDGRVRAGDRLEVSAPRGSFVLAPGDGPVVLLSAGIGATPLLAMLHALAATAPGREVWWLHGARNGRSHPFAAEARGLLRTLARARSLVLYSRPEAGDQPGQGFDAVGRLEVDVLRRLGVPREADFHLCGPPTFLRDLEAGLLAWGVAAARIHAEVFAGSAPLPPGVVATTTERSPHPPPGPDGGGPLVSFARSGVVARFRPAAWQSLLELAEACDVPVRWSCRTGVCHSCESGLVSGAVAYQPEPLDAPAPGNLLVCCARPEGDVVIDL